MSVGRPGNRSVLPRSFLTGLSLRECVHCHVGTMVVIDCIARPKVCQPVPDTS